MRKLKRVCVRVCACMCVCVCVCVFMPPCVYTCVFSMATCIYLRVCEYVRSSLCTYSVNISKCLHRQFSCFNLSKEKPSYFEIYFFNAVTLTSVVLRFVCLMSYFWKSVLLSPTETTALFSL